MISTKIWTHLSNKWFLVNHVTDVHGIFHTASPIDFSIDTYEGMVIPAVKGTETVLHSALKAGSQLSSVVITSSVAAVTNFPPPAPGYVFNESDFASNALNAVEKDKAEGKKSPPGLLYTASKTAAEKAVWKFRDEYKVGLFHAAPLEPQKSINKSYSLSLPYQQSIQQLSLALLLSYQLPLLV